MSKHFAILTRITRPWMADFPWTWRESNPVHIHFQFILIRKLTRFQGRLWLFVWLVDWVIALIQHMWYFYWGRQTLPGSELILPLYSLRHILGQFFFPPSNREFVDHLYLSKSLLIIAILLVIFLSKIPVQLVDEKLGLACPKSSCNDTRTFGILLTGTEGKKMSIVEDSQFLMRRSETTENRCFDASRFDSV